MGTQVQNRDVAMAWPMGGVDSANWHADRRVLLATQWIPARALGAAIVTSWYAIGRSLRRRRDAHGSGRTLVSSTSCRAYAARGARSDQEQPGA